MPCVKTREHIDERGFTLMEVVLVLLLIAMMAGLVFQWSPRLTAPDAETEHQKALMIARIAHARNQAVLRNKKVSIEVKNGTSLYYQNDMTPLPGEGRLAEDTEGYAVTLTTVTLNSSHGDSFTMTFGENFTYTGPATVTLTLIDDATKTTTLTFNGVGYVE